VVVPIFLEICDLVNNDSLWRLALISVILWNVASFPLVPRSISLKTDKFQKKSVNRVGLLPPFVSFKSAMACFNAGLFPLSRRRVR